RYGANTAMSVSRRTTMTPATAILSRRKRRNHGAFQPPANVAWSAAGVPVACLAANAIPAVRQAVRSVVANGRVHHAVQDVHQRVDHHDDRGVNHQPALNERIVPLLN